MRFLISEISGYWDYGILSFWDPEFWVFGFLGFLVFEIFGFWDYGILRFWDPKFLGVWDFGSLILGFWDYGFLGLWAFGISGF